MAQIKEDNFITDTSKIVAGINKATDRVKVGYGAAGSNVIIEEIASPYHRVTNDAKLIVDALKLADPYEMIGKNIIGEVGDNADRDSGDGRKTTMILTQAIFEEAKSVKGLPNVVRKSLNDCIPVLVAAIDGQKRDITVDEVKAVATISSESEEIGEVIQRIYQEVGREAIIEVDNSNLPQTFYEITEGVRLRGAKAFGEYAYTEEGRAVIKNPYILISQDKISSVDELDAMMLQLKKVGINELVIYCEDIDLPIASRLAMTHNVGAFKTLLIKAPTLWKDWLYEDFAKMTGATTINSKEGRTFKNFEQGWLGTCDKVVANNQETRVIGIKDIKDHIALLNASAISNDQMKLRVAWLQTKVATLKVGANSESELSLVSKKAKDACAAAYLALKDGVVVGGGKALFNARKSLEEIDTPGAKIMSQALVYPMRQIISNAGNKMESLPLWSYDDRGFDAKTGQVVDLFEASIIDPAIVVKNAIKNSISVASTEMSAHGIIKLQRDENPTPMR